MAGQCQVTKSSRRCAACRLAKCLSIGMDPDLIRKEDLTINRSKSTESVCDHSSHFIRHIFNIQNPPVTPANPSWSSNEWNIISNIVHAFETFDPTKDIRRQIEQVTSAASSIQFDLAQSCQIISSYSNAFQLFISSIPDFQVLSVAEQRSLFRRNFFGLLAFGGIFLMGQSGIFDSMENAMALQPLYGIEMFQRLQTLHGQFHFDPVLVKLFLVALAFSSSCDTKYSHENETSDDFLVGTFRLYGSQNVYIELMWKYLIHRYEYYQSIQRFSSLIHQFLNAWNLFMDIYRNNSLFQQLIDQIEQTFLTNEQTRVPLWGKR